LRKIATWLRTRGYRLRRGKRFEVCTLTREVHYPANASRRLRTIGLLH